VIFSTKKEIILVTKLYGRMQELSRGRYPKKPQKSKILQRFVNCFKNDWKRFTLLIQMKKENKMSVKV
jgi:hypothetical protein